MAGKDKTGRSSGQLGSFVALPKYLLKSAAYGSLGLPARAALIEILARYNGINNGRLGISARTLAASLSISRATGTRALNELCEKGFLEGSTAKRILRENQTSSRISSDLSLL